MTWTCGELASRCRGRLSGDPAAPLQGVSTDTRTLERGDLFVAIRGPNFDGHEFLDEAVRRGAAGLLVSRDGATSGAVATIRVADTVAALGSLAAAERARFAGPVVAITGSNGKTGTKELCAGLLAAAGLRVRRSPGSLNNAIGLPLSILRLQPDDQALVVELGMNHTGEIDYLARIASPDVGAITQVAAAHLGPVGSLDAIARAKGELFDHVRPRGTAVLNADDPRVVAQGERFSGAHLRFALEAEAEFRARDVVVDRDGTRFRLECAAGAVDVRLPRPGRHLVANALCAAACAVASGALPDDPRAVLRAGLEAFPGVPQRLELRWTPGGVALLDDSYNANPVSARASLETLLDVARGARTLAALGDMLELGPDEVELHAALGRTAANLGIDVLVAVGALSAHCARAAREAGLLEVHEVADAESAGDLLCRLAEPGDAVLVKGSRGAHMERAVARLLGSEG